MFFAALNNMLQKVKCQETCFVVMMIHIFCLNALMRGLSKNAEDDQLTKNVFNVCKNTLYI